MSFLSYKLLKCHTATKRLRKFGRLVYLETRDAIIETELQEGIERERTEIDGFYLTQNPVIDMNRLLIREDAAETLREQGMNDAGIQQGILDARITRELRGLAEKYETRDQKRLGFFGKKLRSVREVVGDLTNPVRAVGRIFGGADAARYNSSHERDIDERLNQLFGQNRGNIDAVAAFIVNEIRTQNNVGLTLAAPLFGLTPPTPARLAAYLEDPTTTLLQLEERLEIARTVPNADFVRSYELLLNVREIAARERSKQISIHTYNPTRLSRFLASMENFMNDDYKLLTEQILQKDALRNLDGDPVIQALLAQLMFSYESNGGGNRGITVLRGILTRIRDALPEVKTGGENENKAENVKLAEKVDEETKALKKIGSDLSKQYRTAPLIADSLRNLYTARRGGGTPKQIAAIDAEIRQKEDQRNKHLGETSDAETAYADAASDLMSTLLKSKKQTTLPVAPPPLVRLRELQGVGALRRSTARDLYGDPTVPPGTPGSAPAPSPFEDRIALYTNAVFKELITEIDDNYKKTITGRERISARELLVALKENRLQQQGVTDPGRRARMADRLANLSIARAETVDVYRAGNHEAAETLINGWRGFGRRVWQTIAGKFFNSSVFNARFMIDHVAGLGHEAEAEGEGKEKKIVRYNFLEGLDPNMSLNDLRTLIKNKGVSIEALYGARRHLQKILIGIELEGKDKAEISDADGLIVEKLCENLSLIEQELESIEFAEKVADPAIGGDNKAENLKKLWKERAENAATRRKRVAVALDKFPKTLRKFLMKEEWGPVFEEGIKEAEELGYTGAARERYLHEKKNIPMTVLKVLLHTLAMKEAADIAAGIAGKVGGHIGKGVSATAKFGAEKSGNLVSAAFKKMKTGAGKGVDMVTSVPGKVWTGTKYIGSLPGKAVKKAWKLGVAPFALAGSILVGGFNLFHYPAQKEKENQGLVEKHKDHPAHFFVKSKKPKAEGDGKKKGGH